MEKFSFPYNTNPLCKDCQHLHVDREEDNIKKWCDLPEDKDCSVLKTYKGDSNE
jgi:hypothetical protein